MVLTDDEWLISNTWNGGNASMNRLNLITFCLLCFLSLFGCAPSCRVLFQPNPGIVSWHVLDVSDESAQADANLLLFENGQVVLIDAGETTATLVPRLQALGVTRIEKIFISHPHKDHYNGLFSLIQSSIKIGEVYLNEPPKSLCDAEKPWGCDLANVSELITRLKAAGIPLKQTTPGESYIKFGTVELSAIHTHDGKRLPVGPSDINDLSVIMLLRVGDIKALFTGDLNLKFGSHLASLQDPKLKAQLLKVPHHGAESLAPNSFFDWVDPEAGFVPAPALLWRSTRCERVRNWFDSRKKPAYVTGVNGSVRIDIFNEEYQIKVSN
jgi:beta-lactamase superfamily II metal-dependent hydrolase